MRLINTVFLLTNSRQIIELYYFEDQRNKTVDFSADKKSSSVFTGAKRLEQFVFKIGGNVWESNPPKRLLTPYTGFEDQRAHQNSSTPMLKDCKPEKRDSQDRTQFFFQTLSVS